MRSCRCFLSHLEPINLYLGLSVASPLTQNSAKCSNLRSARDQRTSLAMTIRHRMRVVSYAKLIRYVASLESPRPSVAPRAPAMMDNAKPLSPGWLRTRCGQDGPMALSHRPFFPFKPVPDLSNRSAARQPCGRLSCLTLRPPIGMTRTRQNAQ
jgi:hypothetical protein